MAFRNTSGYADPTAGAAMKSQQIDNSPQAVQRRRQQARDRRAMQVIDMTKRFLRLTGYECAHPFVIRDRYTRKEYK